ncbi:MAG: tetratricopeptide repeat protein [Methanomassiliicoccales archaeon]|nr:tetratricopeptide repeat protein [Methanomassiliicoccales archaeon]
MVCTFCGAPSLEGAMVCAACSKRVKEEIYLRDWAMDPRSDLRSLGTRSACLRVGPSSQGEVLLGKGTDPYLLVQRTMQAEDRSHLPTVVDQYLSGMGLGLHLMGDEQLPERPVTKELVSLPQSADFEGERWGRALLRLGNILAISARDVSRLPLGDLGRKEAFAQKAAEALDLYQRAGKVPEVEPIARANIAMLRHWGGEHEAALDELRAVVPASDGARLQLARVLLDLGREDEAADIVAQTDDLEGSIVRLRRGCQ